MISVIVIGKNEEHNLPSCFQNIEKACRFLSHEIIYVDSASTDRSLEIAREHAHCVMVTDPDPNPGLGRYIGTTVSSGEWLLYLDADMQLEDGFIAKALPAADHAQADAVTGIRHDIYFQNGKVIEENPNYFDCHTQRVCPEFGGALLIRREALLGAGGWACDTVACEEEELHARLIAKGLNVIEIPVPMIIHTDHVRENRDPFDVIFSKRRLGEGEAFRCACAQKAARAYILRHKQLFVFFAADLLALILLLVLGLRGLPIFCMLEALQLGYFFARKRIRSFVTQKLFFFSFPAGCLTYHVRSRDYLDVSGGADHT